MNIQTFSEKLSQINTDFQRVNWGGCGCVAAILAEGLKDLYPIMRITSTGSDSLDAIRSRLSNPLDKHEWTDNGVNFGHVWVEVFINGEWYALDSTGATPLDDMYDHWGTPAEGSFTIEEITALADTPTWNRSFDRDQIPEIQTRITDIIHNCYYAGEFCG